MYKVVGNFGSYVDNLQVYAELWEVVCEEESESEAVQRLIEYQSNDLEHSYILVMD